MNEDLTMNDPDDDLRQQIALFRYGLIADLVHLPVGAPGAGAMKRAKAEQTYSIPGTTCCFAHYLTADFSDYFGR